MSELIKNAQVLIIGPQDQSWAKTRDSIVSGLRKYDPAWKAYIAFYESFPSALLRIAERDRLDLVVFCVDPRLGREDVLRLFWEVADVVKQHRDQPWLAWQNGIESMATICCELKINVAGVRTIPYAIHDRLLRRNAKR